MAHLKGVIWDVDETLVDSNDAHAHAWVEALKHGGYDVPYEKVRRLVGMGSDNMLPEELVDVKTDTEKGKQLSEWWSAIFKKKYLNDIKPFPHVRDLLQRVHDTGLRMAVASSGEEDVVKTLIGRVGAGDLFQEETSSADAKNSKPDPNIIQAALKKLDCKADEAILVGDTPYDIKAGQKAGVAVIALRCGGWEDKDLHGAIAIYDSPADMLAHFDQSPLDASLQEVK